MAAKRDILAGQATVKFQVRLWYNARQITDPTLEGDLFIHDLYL
ncbi:MAG: hypothetical protein ACOYL5_16580 [Phototrophicaceae bacterium]